MPEAHGTTVGTAGCPAAANRAPSRRQLAEIAKKPNTRSGA